MLLSPGSGRAPPPGWYCLIAEAMLSRRKSWPPGWAYAGIPASKRSSSPSGRRVAGRTSARAGTDAAVTGADDAAPRAGSAGTGRTALPGIYNTLWASVPHRTLMPSESPFTLLQRHGQVCTDSEAQGRTINVRMLQGPEELQVGGNGYHGGAWRKGMHVLV